MNKVTITMTMTKSYSQSVKPILWLLSLVGLYLPNTGMFSGLGTYTLHAIGSCFVWFLGVGLQACQLWHVISSVLSGSESAQGMFALVFPLLMVCQLFIAVVFTLNVSACLPRFARAVDAYFASYGLRPTIKTIYFFTCAVYVLYVMLVIVTVHSVVSSHSCAAQKLEVNEEDSYPKFRCVAVAVMESVERYFFVTAYGSPGLLYIFVWRTLFLEARRFNKDFAESDLYSPPKTAHKIEALNQRHVALCKLIERGNDTMRAFLIIAYGAGIPVVLISLHVGISGGDVSVRALALIMMVHMCLQLGIVTITGAVLNLQMHRPRHLLGQVKTSDMTDKGMECVMLFLHRLQSESIGFDVLGLFTVDTSTINMVCGTILTYAVVIVQMKPQHLTRDLHHAVSNST